VAKNGEVETWSSHSEDPTEFGVVWERLQPGVTRIESEERVEAVPKCNNNGENEADPKTPWWPGQSHFRGTNEQCEASE
jgi:hypothetical protein